MVDLAAFRGLRYADPDALADLTAPPYDAIDAGTAAELRRRHPHNVVRLERAESTGGDDAYARAGRTYQQWIASGVLRRDVRPCLYVYEQGYVEGGAPRRQRGVFAALRLVPWDDGAVLPHEDIYRPAVEDRLRLLRALPANTSAVFGLAAEEPAEVARALDEVTRDPALSSFRIGEVDHRFWPVARSDLQEAIVAGYRDTVLLMADGHHRYTTALEHRDADPGRPGADRILTYVVGGDGPVIRPSHRVLPQVTGDPAGTLREAGYVIRDLEVTDRSPAGIAHAATSTLDGHDGPAFVLVAGSAWLISGDGASVDLPPHVDDLDVALAHAAASGPLGVGAGQADITSDAVGAVASVLSGRAGAAMLVRSVPVSRVRDTASRGLRMPPKSTAFHPKPRTGLVLRPLEAPAPAGGP